MPRVFRLLEEVGDVVEAQAGPQLPEVSRNDPERLRRAGGTPGRETGPDRLVHDVAEGPPRPVNLRGLGSGLDFLLWQCPGASGLDPERPPKRTRNV